MRFDPIRRLAIPFAALAIPLFASCSDSGVETSGSNTQGGAAPPASAISSDANYPAYDAGDAYSLADSSAGDSGQIPADSGSPDATAGEGEGTISEGEGAPAEGEGEGEGADGSAGDGDGSQPPKCEVYGCAATPLCANGCTDVCGCCPCVEEESFCARETEAGDFVVWACTSGCYELTPCGAGEICNELIDPDHPEIRRARCIAEPPPIP